MFSNLENDPEKKFAPYGSPEDSVRSGTVQSSDNLFKSWLRLNLACSLSVLAVSVATVLVVGITFKSASEEFFGRSDAYGAAILLSFFIPILISMIAELVMAVRYWRKSHQKGLMFAVPIVIMNNLILLMVGADVVDGIAQHISKL